MSLHQYLVPPPLALAIHPAPPYKSSSADKSKDKKPDDKEKKPDNNAKQQDDNAKQQDDKKDKPVDSPGDNGQINGDADGAKGAPPPADKAEEGAEPAPISPGSMVPEPATPATSVVADADKPAELKLVMKEDEPANKASDQIEVNKPAHQDSKDMPRDQDSEDKPKDPEPEPLPEPLRLIGPCPKLPIRTKLDLDPSKPWPPIETDPRGAYHHYAKGVYRGLKESLRIDVTKDGWMSEQWREKVERDALARLRGEDVKKAQRELEAEARRRQVKKVPSGAGEVLLLLWNALVEAPNNEVGDHFSPRIK
jgi:hypothetical protein